METNLRYGELWEALRDRLNTERMQRMLGGLSRVYLEGEDYSRPEGNEGTRWARLVVVPAVSLWPAGGTGMAPTRPVGFLVRAEHSNYVREGYSIQVSLDAIQEEAEDQLVGWCPEGLTWIRCALPIYLYAGAQPRPMWDDKRGLWWTSGHYRTEVAKALKA